MKQIFLLIAIVPVLFVVIPACLAEQVGDRNVTASTAYSDDEIVAIVSKKRAGADLTPPVWPNGAKVAVLFSLDVDNEMGSLGLGVEDALLLSFDEYGSRRGLKRLVDIFDSHAIPVTFFLPAMSLQIAPEMADVIKAAGHHEVALHGWAHEMADTLTEEQHRRLLRRSSDYLTEVFDTRPVGYRAPMAVVADHTIPLLRELELIYDSSFVSDDRPYELVANGQATGLVTLPMSTNLEDTLLLTIPNELARSFTPRDVLQIYKDEFDVAYDEGGIVLFVLHPQVSGQRSRSVIYKNLIEYMKSKENVWFGTHRQAAEYILAVKKEALP